MTLDEISKVYQRNIAGESSLKFFKDVVQVQSPNFGISSIWRNDKANDVLSFYRRWYKEWVITQVFEDAARTAVGNCAEKAAICFASLASNPRILHNSFVTLCRLVHGDHLIALVTEQDISNKHSFYISDLSEATMVVDGWVEDYYFPNLSPFETARFNLGTTPNPVQLFIRCKVNLYQLSVKKFIFLPEWHLTT